MKSQVKCPNCLVLIRSLFEYGQWGAELVVPCQKCPEAASGTGVKLCIFVVENEDFSYSESIIPENALFYLRETSKDQLLVLIERLKEINKLGWLLDRVVHNLREIIPQHPRFLSASPSEFDRLREVVGFLQQQIFKLPKEEWAVLLVQTDYPEFWVKRLKNDCSLFDPY